MSFVLTVLMKLKYEAAKLLYEQVIKNIPL